MRLAALLKMSNTVAAPRSGVGYGAFGIRSVRCEAP